MILAVENTQNMKTGPISTTFAPLQTCPVTCPFKDGGCYSLWGPCGWKTKQITRDAERQRANLIDIAEAEAEGIVALTGDRPLRLHVSGDAPTPSSAFIISEACAEYYKRSKSPVWVFTHAWRAVPRECWGGVSAMASVETLPAAREAMAAGYAVSIVVPEAFTGVMKVGDVKMVMCRHTMNNSVKCRDCKLCMNDKKLRAAGKVVCFTPHGRGAKDVLRHIKEVNNGSV